MKQNKTSFHSTLSLYLLHLKCNLQETPAGDRDIMKQNKTSFHSTLSLYLLHLKCNLQETPAGDRDIMKQNKTSFHSTLSLYFVTSEVQSTGNSCRRQRHNETE